MKYFLIFCILMQLSVSVIKAEKKGWLDGITLRIGYTSQTDSLTLDNDSFVKSNTKINQKKLGGMGPPGSTDKFPLAISFPETLMNSWSFRQMYFDYVPYSEVNDLPPDDPDFESKLTSAEATGTGTIYLVQSEWQQSFIKDTLFNGNTARLEFINNNTNWALSSDIKRSAVFLGYMWGVFYPSSETNRWMKIGLGVGIGYGFYDATINLCTNYVLSLSYKDDGKLDDVHNGKCNGKTKIDEIHGQGPIGSVGLHVTVYESFTKESVWKFVSFDISGPIGGDSSEFNLKNFNQQKIKTSSIANSLDVISYTYRF